MTAVVKSGTAVPHSKTWPFKPIGIYRLLFGVRHCSVAFTTCASLPPCCVELAMILHVQSDWRTRFVPVCALLVGVRDLQNPRFIQRFA